MGRADKGGAGGGAGDQTLALSVNAEGDINYDAVLTQSRNTQKWLQTTHKALVPKPEELAAGVSALVPPPVPTRAGTSSRPALLCAACSGCSDSRLLCLKCLSC